MAERIRRWLNISVERQESWRDGYDALTGWISALESRDVLVFQTGNVRIDEMRGFSISDDVMPVIVLNSKDTPHGRVFTLLHELIHLSLFRAGICTPVSFGAVARGRDEHVEAFCNRVAGAVLLPAEYLLADHRVKAAGPRKTWDDPTLASIAGRFGVSKEVVLRRLLLIGKTSKHFYERKRAEYLARYRRIAAKSTPILQPYRMAVRDNGKRFTRLVLDALEKQKITSADGIDYLGIRVKHLDQVASAVDYATT